jgi:hypothetical protein
MSGASSDQSVPRARARTAGWLLFALVCVALFIAVSGPAAAGQVDAENDTEAPEWGNATVSEGSLSELNVTFYDNGQIERRSVNAGDFDVSGRAVREIESPSDVGANGTGVAVVLELAGPV